ncbi:MAG: GatB/YqeY domain-containing protein, partial [Alphaproteobacteria bacterium]
KDMGRTMTALRQTYAGQMDFGKASAIVRERLA